MISRAAYIDETIRQLEEWSESRGDFNGDRALGDRVLIADGWQVFEDAQFSGGFRWEQRAPGGGAVCMAEATRGNPIRDMNMAIGVVPFGRGWMVRHVRGKSQALIWNPDAAPGSDQIGAFHDSAPIALLIAALHTIKANL